MGALQGLPLCPPGLTPVAEVLCEVLVSSSCMPITLVIMTSVPVSRCHSSDCTKETDPKLKQRVEGLWTGWSVPGVGLLAGASGESELGPAQAICCSGALGPGTFLGAWGRF